MVEIGLFPLGIVLVPGERVPLHIFEPRYRELIGECLEDVRDFGLVLEDEEGMRRIGTTAAVVRVLERFDDGRMNVVVEGRRRFAVLAETSGRSFRTATIEALDDDDDPPSPEEEVRLLDAYRRLAEAAEGEADEPEGHVPSLAYWVAARVELAAAVKQELLELRSERARVALLTRVLDRLRESLLFARTARERARTNGRVEPPG